MPYIRLYHFEKSIFLSFEKIIPPPLVLSDDLLFHDGKSDRQVKQGGIIFHFGNSFPEEVKFDQNPRGNIDVVFAQTPN